MTQSGRPSAENPLASQGWSDVEERVGWAIFCALHEKVPEDKRPTGWTDLNGEQLPRIRAAANAAIKANLAGEHPSTGMREALELAQKIIAAKESYDDKDAHTRDGIFFFDEARAAMRAATVNPEGKLLLLARALSSTGDAMRAFGASDEACYRWPDDTPEHKALRAAFIAAASSTGDERRPTEAERNDLRAVELKIRQAMNYGMDGHPWSLLDSAADTLKFRNDCWAEAVPTGDERREAIEECAKLMEGFPDWILHMWERPGGPPGNGYAPTTNKDRASRIRSLLHAAPVPTGDERREGLETPDNIERVARALARHDIAVWGWDEHDDPEAAISLEVNKRWSEWTDNALLAIRSLLHAAPDGGGEKS